MAERLSKAQRRALSLIVTSTEAYAHAPGVGTWQESSGTRWSQAFIDGSTADALVRRGLAEWIDQPHGEAWAMRATDAGRAAVVDPQAGTP